MSPRLSVMYCAASPFLHTASISEAHCCTVKPWKLVQWVASECFLATNNQMLQFPRFLTWCLPFLSKPFKISSRLCQWNSYHLSAKQHSWHPFLREYTCNWNTHFLCLKCYTYFKKSMALTYVFQMHQDAERQGDNVGTQKSTQNLIATSSQSNYKIYLVKRMRHALNPKWLRKSQPPVLYWPIVKP